jgi:hypothetical protein
LTVHFGECEGKAGRQRMTSSDQFEAFAAARGEGLHPKLCDLFQRTAASPFSETFIRPDGMLQAGSSPASETASQSGTVVSFPREERSASSHKLATQRPRKSIP